MTPLSTASASYEATLDAAGRVVIPARLRHACGLEPGAALTLRLEADGKLSLEPRLAALRRAQEKLSSYADDGPLWSERLIAERRASVGKEYGE